MSVALKTPAKRQFYGKALRFEIEDYMPGRLLIKDGVTGNPIMTVKAETTEEEIKLIMLGYEAGWQDGRVSGRSAIQGELRELLGVKS